MRMKNRGLLRFRCPTYAIMVVVTSRDALLFLVPWCCLQCCQPLEVQLRSRRTQKVFKKCNSVLLGPMSPHSLNGEAVFLLDRVYAVWFVPVWHFNDLRSTQSLSGRTVHISNSTNSRSSGDSNLFFTRKFDHRTRERSLVHLVNS